METLDPARCVRPRVLARSAPGGWLLEDLIDERLARGSTGVVWIAGACGSGLRTTRALLAWRFSGDARVVIDASSEIASVPPAGTFGSPRLHVRFTRRFAPDADVLRLAPWSRDEWIEYLLARHPQDCASVMQRLESLEPPLESSGVPLVWAALLDALAEDESLASALDALRAVLTRVFASGSALSQARAMALQLRQSSEHEIASRMLAEAGEIDHAWLAQPCVQLLLAAESVVLLLEHGAGEELARVRLEDQLLRATEPLLARSPRAFEQAASLLSSGPAEVQPWAASLVHLAGPTAFRGVWALRKGREAEPAILAEARLARAQANDLDLCGIEGSGIELSAARLDGSNLRDANLCRAVLGLASLRGCALPGCDLRGADLRAADLNGVHARGAFFDAARLDQADLRGANLKGAQFEGASLCGTQLEGADLAGANLARMDLRGVRGLPASFSAANLTRAQLEGLAGEEMDFSRADLQGALLSSTRFHRANFQNAILRDAGLAWIDWEGANLFGADLSGASFHLGSSRSGLVLNAPASWGTRTGFYTDEEREQGFQAPEAIRKANLRGADLRTAKILQTDFYLVDLRGALYTPEQEKHLRGCGAIL